MAEWERELNALVYELYSLTDEEIKIVEEASQKTPQPRGGTT